ncbi:MAG TPA: hypothetical protein PKY77_16215 [Phycisphaerae bacterium]|nr:hypothetical protein [Phycisphaerae bacterium]HRY70798.1 hypothetical protein [Phycisphaerae bacterium]HSA29216.1 hypothetical protein [Phycisphaerae bacterium]
MSKTFWIPRHYLHLGLLPAIAGTRVRDEITPSASDGSPAIRLPLYRGDGVYVKGQTGFRRHVGEV